MEDTRVIDYLEKLGTMKVKIQLEKGGFSGRNLLAQKWLKSKRRSVGLKFLKMTGLL